MKVFILRNAWKNTDYGGAEELALSVVSELSKQNITAKLISGTKSLIDQAKKSKTPLSIGPFSKHQILTKHRFVFLPKYLLDLYLGYRSYLKIFSEEKPDLIHATGQQDSISSTSAARKMGIPVVWSDHGELKDSIGFKILPPWGIPGFFLKRHLKHIEALCMVNLADISFINSLKTNVPIKKFPNGVVDRKSNSNKNKFDLVFASRVIKEKGIFELLEAYEQVLKIKPQTTLLIAGEGPSLSEVKNIVESKKLKNVTFSVYSDKAIENANIFVLPTYTEAQSLAILKAMMYETPILSTNIKGNTHFLEHEKNAFLVNPKSSTDLYSGLSLLLDGKTRRERLAKNARMSFMKDNTLQSIVSKYYLPLYKSIKRTS